MIEFSAPAVVPHDPRANATELLLDRVRATPEIPLFALPNSSGGWDDITARQFYDEVVALAKGFVAAGIKVGDRVGLMCKTRYEWSLIDFAMWFAGASLVPIYETSSPSQIEWILQDSEAVALVAETREHLGRYESIKQDAPFVHTTWCLEEGALAALNDLGLKIDDAEIERRRALAQGKDLATLIYTSGSTGKPKGCVLTHANFVDLCRNSTVALASVVNERASTVLFITTAHIFARFIAVLAVTGGVKVGHQPDTSQLLPALQSFKPTFLLAVPRVFEKVYNSAEQRAESGGKGKIFRAAAKVAVEHSRAVEDGKVPVGLKVKFALYDRLVYSKLRAAMGGRVEFAVSGSAPLGERLGRFFHSLGIMILEGYGLTETTAPATVNRPEKFKIGTVGPVMPGVSIRLTNEGEIEVKGLDVFDGYWKNPQATKEAFDKGWFKTGDIGSFDDDGYLRITGRKKEIIVTASGKNVSPAFLEDPIRSDPLVGQVVVVGDAKPFIAALITLDAEMMPMWLANKKLDPHMSIADAAKNPEVVAGVQAAIDRANARVSRAESIRKFSILPVEFTEQSGHLTPKMSIKRNIIHEDFSTEIEAMYAQESLPGD